MLVLSRKLGEKIMVGEDIVLTVVSIDRGKIRLGIEAPRNVECHRKEVWDKIHEVKTAATVSPEGAA